MQTTPHTPSIRRAPIVALAAVALLGGAGCAPAARTSAASAPAAEPALAAVDPRALDPRTPLTRAQQRWVDSTLASLTLRERVGQMVWRWVLGDYASTDDSSFARARHDVADLGVGGITMSLGSPIEVAAKINALQRLAKVPLVVSSDLEPNLGRLEGGVFTHYLTDAGGATVIPNAMAIGATGREEDAYDAGRVIASEARAIGFHVNFAPTVDVNNNPSNPVINVRSFGEDPASVARLSSLFIRGTRDGGLIATAKHFPGHGDTDVDSHVGLPVVGASRARLDSVELVPFRAAIDAGVGMIMTAHLALPAFGGDSATPATLRPEILTGLLRDTLHFGGTTITDAMTMEGVGKGYSPEEAATRALMAGAEILLMPRDAGRTIDAVVAAVERGAIPRERIDRGARRVLELKARSGAAWQRTVSLERLRAVVGSAEHRRVAQDIANRAVTLLRDRDSLVPLRGGRTAVVQYLPETELKAGRALLAELRLAGPIGATARLRPTSAASELDSVARLVRTADRVVVAVYVRRVEGEGRNAVPAHVAQWIDSLAATQKVVVVSLGNPYLIRQFPRVGSYLVTYGVNDALERAAARALAGRIPITGRAPVTLPGYFARGDGLKR